MRTLVVSDLHLGSRTRVDVLRRPAALDALTAAAADADRVVLLGDTLELRHAPVREILGIAEPVLRALGAAVGAGGEVVVVAGNHDHGILRPFFEQRAADGPAPPLALDEAIAPATSPVLARMAELLAPATTTVRYPGLWIRDDVLALHGHYLDRLVTIPSFERLAAGAIQRLYGRPLPPRATPDDFESALAPIYGFLDAIALRVSHDEGAAPAKSSVRAWELLSKDGRRPWLGYLAAPAVPLSIFALNRAGIGPLRAEFTGVELRRAGVRAMREALARLGVDAPHVLFGHTHRSGPSPSDDHAEWGPLLNTGCWVHEPTFTRNGKGSPYWPGRAAIVEATGPPRLVGLLDDVPESALRVA